LTDQKADFRDTCAVILAVNTERYGTSSYSTSAMYSFRSL